MLNVTHHGRAMKKIFTLDCLKVLNDFFFFFTFLSYWKTSDLHIVPVDFYKKGLHKEVCKKPFENILD